MPPFSLTCRVLCGATNLGLGNTSNTYMTVYAVSLYFKWSIILLKKIFKFPIAFVWKINGMMIYYVMFSITTPTDVVTQGAKVHGPLVCISYIVIYYSQDCNISWIFILILLTSWLYFSITFIFFSDLPKYLN